MLGMNEGIAYLVVIPPGPIRVIDLGGRTIDERCTFLIAVQGVGTHSNSTSSLQKIAMVLSVTGDYKPLIAALPLKTFVIGGAKCHICQKLSSNTQIDRS
jgi:hypothetical protein